MTLQNSENPVPQPVSGTPKTRLPKAVWAVGFVSMFMDISSEMIQSMLPVFLATALATPIAVIGIIEGISEATASIVKLFSGRLSDWLGRRKPLLLAGYGLATLCKPLFPMAESAFTILFAKFADRVGKGIRGAPRDALVADFVAPEQRGAAFGLRQSLDTTGAVIGPLIAIALLAANGGDIRQVFWLAVIPAIICCLIIVFMVPEPKQIVSLVRQKQPLFSGAGEMPRSFWIVLLIAAILQAARPSEGFILLRASNLGLDMALIPAVLIAMNLAYALSAYPLGMLADRLNRASLLATGTLLIVASLAMLGMAEMLAPVYAIELVFAAACIWGLHLGMTQGLLAAMVADQAPAHLRGTSFGLYHLASGMAMLPGNIAFGYIWDASTPATAFIAASAASLLAMFPLLLFGRMRSS